MDWANLLRNSQDQGLLYWVAVAAIAGGSSLLLVSVYLHLRRSHGGEGPGWARILARKLRFGIRTTAASPASGLIDARPYASSPRAAELASPRTTAAYAAAAAAAEPEPAVALSALLPRLQCLSDRLEDMTARLRDAHTRGQSSLKPVAPGVEYVFKANRS